MLNPSAFTVKIREKALTMAHVRGAQLRKKLSVGRTFTLKDRECLISMRWCNMSAPLSRLPVQGSHFGLFFVPTKNHPEFLGGVDLLPISLSQELYQFLHLRLPASITWIAILVDDYMSLCSDVLSCLW